MVEYDQLVFLNIRKTKQQSLEEDIYWAKEGLIESVNTGNYNWPSFNSKPLSLDDITVLGVDEITKKNGSWTHLLWCSIPAVHADVMATYYDMNGNPKDTPVDEKEDGALFEKYDFFLFSMDSFRRNLFDVLEDLEKKYALELHIKPNVMEEKIEVKFNYNNNSFLAVEGEQTLKESILQPLDSLPFEDKLQLRTYRAKTALKDLYDSLVDEFTEKVMNDDFVSKWFDSYRHRGSEPEFISGKKFAQRMLAVYLKNEKQEKAPLALAPSIAAYRNLKTSLAKILSFETKLIEAGKSDILQFDKAVQSLLDCAKNPTGRQFFDVQYIKTMSENYNIKPYKQDKKPTEGIILS